MKQKIRATLSPHESALLEEAVKTYYGGSMSPQGKRLIIRLAITSLSTAIIKRGGLVLPLAVEMRTETREETEARVHGVLPERGSAPASPVLHVLPDWKAAI